MWSPFRLLASDRIILWIIRLCAKEVVDLDDEHLVVTLFLTTMSEAIPGYLSRFADGTARLKGLDVVIVGADCNCLTEIRRDRERFHADGDAALLDQAAGRAGTRTFSESSDAAVQMAGRSMDVRAGFYQFLASLDSWDRLADGAFERAMARQMKQS